MTQALTLDNRLIPADKHEQRTLAEAIIRQVSEGEISPIEAVVQMKSLADAIALFLKDDTIRQAVISACEAYGRGERPQYRGATVQVKETGVSYDFLATGDPIYADLIAREQQIAEQRKEREKFLKNITHPMTLVDEATGEVIELLPPARRSTTSYSITFK